MFADQYQTVINLKKVPSGPVLHNLEFSAKRCMSGFEF